MVEIFFHIGLGKTGTKYLQSEFFPKLNGVKYIRPQLYKNAIEKISDEIIKSQKSVKTSKILLSREFDKQLETETLRFSKFFPNTRIIVVFRRHDEWILSQFKRTLKNGYHIKFSEFFNFENTGIFKIQDLIYRKKIEHIKNIFSEPPLILIYDELKNNPSKFLRKITEYMGAKFEENSIPKKIVHRSYGEKELKYSYIISKFIDYKPRDNLIQKYLYVFPIRYSILYLGRFLPEPKIKEKVFPEKEELEKIREFFKDDWNFCVQESLKSEKLCDLKHQKSHE